MWQLPPSPEELELERLHSEVERMARHLVHRTSSLEQLRRDLDAFESTFSRSIQPLQRQLEELSEPHVQQPFPQVEQETEPKTSPKATALYRKLVKSIHPDLAQDDDQRAVFQALMIRANDAYAQYDESALSRLLIEARTALATSMVAEHTNQWVQLINKCAEHRTQLATVNQQYENLTSSELYKLFQSFLPDVAFNVELLKRELELKIHLHQVRHNGQ